MDKIMSFFQGHDLWNHEIGKKCIIIKTYLIGIMCQTKKIFLAAMTYLADKLCQTGKIFFTAMAFLVDKICIFVKFIAVKTWAGVKFLAVKTWAGVKFVIDKICIGVKFLADKTCIGVKFIAVKTWTGVKFIAVKTWTGIKFIADKTWIGVKFIAVKTWTGVKFIAVNTWVGVKFIAVNTWIGVKFISDKTWIGVKFIAVKTWAGVKFIADKTWIGVKFLSDKTCVIAKTYILPSCNSVSSVVKFFIRYIEERFHIYETLLAQKQTIYRAAVVSCMCAAVILHFTLPNTGFTSGSKQIKEQTPVEAGVGGGGSPEKTILEGLHEESIELGMLEPESFSKPRTLLYSAYTVQKGDMIGGLAESFGLNQDTIISINNIKNTRLVQIGQVLRVPNQDGIQYTVKKGDTLEAIAEKYKSSASDIQIANELFSSAALPGTSLFIPGARLDWMERQEINGDLFMWPVSGYITSSYGYRIYPFSDSGGRQFHSGMDIGAPYGAPIRAAMSGRVSSAGWDDVLGNHVVISHHAGYRTLYGHMSVIRVKTGAYVGTGERIGDVGSTGKSTGPHVHFTVYKNGVTVNPRSLLK